MWKDVLNQKVVDIWNSLPEMVVEPVTIKIQT